MEFEEGYSVKTFQECFPGASPRKIKIIYRVFHLSTKYFNFEGNFVKLKLVNGKSVVGIIRNCSTLLGYKERLFVNLEIRNANVISLGTPEERIWVDETKRKEFDMWEISDIEFIKKGNEKLTEKEMEVLIMEAERKSP